MTNFPFLVSATTDNACDSQAYEGPIERVREAARQWSRVRGINVVLVLSNDEERNELARFVNGGERQTI